MHHVEMLRALHSSRACDPKTVREAVELLRLRQIKPDAGRWHKDKCDDSKEFHHVSPETALHFMHIKNAVYVPNRLFVSNEIYQQQDATQSAEFNGATLMRHAQEILSS